jgi:hypothetical protein
MTAGPAPRPSAQANTARPAAARQPANTRSTPVRPARRAIEQALEQETTSVDLPEPIGTVRLPSPRQLAFYGGIAALGVFGIVDWPVVLVIGIGHLLAEDRHHKLLADFGKALAEA